jgi:parallel beta-helix repeat protein
MKRYLIAILIAAALIALAFILPSQAETATSLQQRINDAAASGQQIVKLESSVETTQTITIPENVYVVAEGTATAIKATGSLAKLVRITGSNAGIRNVSVDGNNLAQTCISLEGDNSGACKVDVYGFTSAGISSNKSDCQIERCSITGNANSTYGVILSYASKNYISWNTINGCAGNISFKGVYISYSSTNNNVNKNTICDCGNSGVYLYNSSNYNRIVNNTIYGSPDPTEQALNAQHHGVWIRSSLFNVVSGNIIHDIGRTTTSTGIECLEGSDYNLVSGNTIEHVLGYGCCVASSDYCNVGVNMIHEAHDPGVFLYDSYKSIASINSVFDTSGVIEESCTACEIAGNIED